MKVKREVTKEEKGKEVRTGVPGKGKSLGKGSVLRPWRAGLAYGTCLVAPAGWEEEAGRDPRAASPSIMRGPVDSLGGKDFKPWRDVMPYFGRAPLARGWMG